MPYFEQDLCLTSTIGSLAAAMLDRCYTGVALFHQVVKLNAIPCIGILVAASLEVIIFVHTLPALLR